VIYFYKSRAWSCVEGGASRGKIFISAIYLIWWASIDFLEFTKSCKLIRCIRAGILPVRRMIHKESLKQYRYSCVDRWMFIVVLYLFWYKFDSVCNVFCLLTYLPATITTSRISLSFNVPVGMTGVSLCQCQWSFLAITLSYSAWIEIHDQQWLSLFPSMHYAVLTPLWNEQHHRTEWTRLIAVSIMKPKLLL
jgi:hypothetical protein